MTSPTVSASSVPTPARHFLDAAGGEPLSATGRAALLAALDDGWADPRRLYTEGRRAALLLEAARASVAQVLGARADEVTFTPSGTAAAHRAVLGLLGPRPGSPDTGRAVVSAVEHSSVLNAAGAEAIPVPVDRTGRIELPAFEDALHRGDVRLAAVQSGNHEVGTLQPVESAHALCRERGVPLLVDAAQSVGRLPLGPWDLLTASAHKWGGPPGVGVLAVRRGSRWRPPGPEDESGAGQVAGAPGLPFVLAAAMSLEAAVAESAAQSSRLHRLVDRLREQVPLLVPDTEVVGDPVERLPHLVTFSCLFVDGEALVGELDRLGFAVGSGSACTASTLRPSHVLAAMGALTHGNVRVSLARTTTEEAVEAFLQALPGAVATVRRRGGVDGL